MVGVQFSSLLAVATAIATLALGTTDAARIDAGVHRALRKQGNANIIVTMKDGTAKTLNSIQESAFTTRGAMIENMVEQLELQSVASQQELVGLLSQESASLEPLYKSTKSYWISNQVFIEGASAELIEKLSGLSSVAEVREEEIIPLPQVFAGDANVATNTSASEEWGVRMIKANDVWRDGNTGQGVVVGMIDSGVRGTHQALQSNFRGSYGWYDPERNAAQPYDNNGHGTHVMGTIAGANGIGVAPGATWMACKGCRDRGCSESDLLACAEFMTCPTDTDGNNRDCSKAPRLVSNSWGGGQGRDFYRAAVDAWHKAGIIPIFAIGNSGPSCSTANSPGDYDNVIAVGATDVGDALASFSSKGPSVRGLLKPDISAPGKDVRSAWIDSDSAYRSISGTSMATPHLSGVVALMLKANPNLSYTSVKSLLETSAEQAALKPAGRSCGDTTDGQFPNNNYGHGRVNALSAVRGETRPPTPPGPAPSPSPAPSPVSCFGLPRDQCLRTPGCRWFWFGWCVNA